MVIQHRPTNFFIQKFSNGQPLKTQKSGEREREEREGGIVIVRK